MRAILVHAQGTISAHAYASGREKGIPAPERDTIPTPAHGIPFPRLSVRARWDCILRASGIPFPRMGTPARGQGFPRGIAISACAWAQDAISRVRVRAGADHGLHARYDSRAREPRLRAERRKRLA